MRNSVCVLSEGPLASSMDVKAPGCRLYISESKGFMIDGILYGKEIAKHGEIIKKQSSISLHFETQISNG